MEMQVQVLKLSPDRFTPLSRTPWAGDEIFPKYKAGLVEGGPRPIGEAWEVSCDPDFPSVVLDNGLELSSYLKTDPAALLSRAYVDRKGASCEILVKLLNPASPLSVQVHPTDKDPYLKPHECGKPESWLVLEAAPSSGLYLGFSKNIARSELRTLLQANADIRSYLQFVPVKAGDYFEISPGVPHAIGPGVVLLEPQRVLLGKSGKTYRFWDWGRRYAPDGTLDEQAGKPRELHIEEGLRLIDPEHQVGEAFVDTLRRQAVESKTASGASVFAYPANESYQVFRVNIPKGGKVRWGIEDGFATLVSLGGEFVWTSQTGQSVTFRKGEPGFLPFAAFPLDVVASADSDFAIVIPVGARLTFE